MKKYISLKWAIIIFLFFSYVKDSVAQNVFGLKAGLSLSTWNASLNGTKLAIGMSPKILIGGFANHRFNEILSLQTEVNYQQMGVLMDKVNYQQNYITMPLLLSFDINKLIYVEGGAQMGYLMNAKSNFRDLKKDFKTTDLQVLFGVGYIFDSRREIELRYGMGLKNISNNNVFNMLSNDVKTEISNNALSIVFNYAF